MGHRIPIDIFARWTKSPIPANRKMKNLPTFENFIFEEWSTEAPVGTDWSFLPEEVVQTLIPNFLSKRPPLGNLTVEDSKEIKECIDRNSRVLESDTDILFISEANAHPYAPFVNLIKSAGKEIKTETVKALWENSKNMRIIEKIKDAVKRSRPYWIDSRIVPVEGTETFSYSFPSGHACGAYYMAGKLSKKYPELKEDLHKLADRISNTRVEAGVHFPSDIEAGKAIGECLVKIN
jgi:hypothetical protein